MAEIPRVIHQTWKTGAPPPEWAPLERTWREHHPAWEHRIWTDEDCRAFVVERLQTCSLPTTATRTDPPGAFRYAVLLEEGGVYVDMDMECLRPIDPLLDGASCLLTLEPNVHGAWHGRVDLVSNAFMAAAPGQAVLAAVGAELPRRQLERGLHNEVLSTTGPFMLDDVVRRREWPELKILPATVVSPLVSSSDDLEELRNGGLVGAETVRARLRDCGSFGIHYWSNSWIRGLAGELDNPTPHDVIGYTFVPGMDSVGNDIGNAGRDIDVLAEACDEHVDAVAFNTDGFLKHALEHPSLFTSIPNPNGSEGLYVDSDLYSRRRHARAGFSERVPLLLSYVDFTRPPT